MLEQYPACQLEILPTAEFLKLYSDITKPPNLFKCPVI
jgi:hypothetical protein